MDRTSPCIKCHFSLLVHIFNHNKNRKCKITLVLKSNIQTWTHKISPHFLPIRSQIQWGNALGWSPFSGSWDIKVCVKYKQNKKISLYGFLNRENTLTNSSCMLLQMSVCNHEPWSQIMCISVEVLTNESNKIIYLFEYFILGRVWGLLFQKLYYKILLIDESQNHKNTKWLWLEKVMLFIQSK